MNRLELSTQPSKTFHQIHIAEPSILSCLLLLKEAIKKKNKNTKLWTKQGGGRRPLSKVFFLNKVTVRLGSCDNVQTEMSIFKCGNWPIFQIKRTGPSSWWSVELVHPAILPFNWDLPTLPKRKVLYNVQTGNDPA